MKRRTDSTPMQQGADAMGAGMSTADNPYSPDSKEAADWEKGFVRSLMDAVKSMREEND